MINQSSIEMSTQRKLMDAAHAIASVGNLCVVSFAAFIIVKRRKDKFSDGIYKFWITFLINRWLGNIASLDIVVKYLPQSMFDYLVNRSIWCETIFGVLGSAFVKFPGVLLMLFICLYHYVVVRRPIFYFQVKAQDDWHRKIIGVIIIIHVVSFLLAISGFTHLKFTQCINDGVYIRKEPKFVTQLSPTAVFLFVALYYYGTLLITGSVYLFIISSSYCCPNKKVPETVRDFVSKIERRTGAIGMISFLVSFILDVYFVALPGVLPLLASRALVICDFGIDPWLLLLKNKDFRNSVFEFFGYAKLVNTAPTVNAKPSATMHTHT